MKPKKKSKPKGTYLVLAWDEVTRKMRERRHQAEHTALDHARRLVEKGFTRAVVFNDQDESFKVVEIFGKRSAAISL